jgi:hypothetical protein
MKKSVYLYIFICLLLLSMSYAESSNDEEGGVPDEDQDGVPDEPDICPDSQSSAVDSQGCTCTQREDCSEGGEQYTISGTVFIDNNANSVFDDGDEVFPSRTVLLTDRSRSVNLKPPVTTDSQGFYSFTQLAEGEYRTTHEVPFGFTRTTDDSRVDYINDDLAADFGVTPLEQTPFCGDDTQDAGEECDDGNNLDGDGCDINCVVEFCGDNKCNNGEDSSSCIQDCPIVCPADIYTCDDGSTVKRIPPDCNFDSCPEECPLIYAPICGIDGNTYSNECMAGVSGVDMACKGECPCYQEEPFEYKYSKWTCEDGYSENLADENSCKTVQGWYQIAFDNCQNRCNPYFSFCGLLSFDVREQCKTNVTSKCSDNDGNDYYNKGYVETESETLYDLCYGDYTSDDRQQYLIEYSCDETALNSEFVKINYECANGCHDGACVIDHTYLIERDIENFDYVRSNPPSCRFILHSNCEAFAADYEYKVKRLFFFNKKNYVYAIIEHFDGDLSLDKILSYHPFERVKDKIGKAEVYAEQYYGNDVIRVSLPGFNILAWISGENLVILDFEGPLPIDYRDLLKAYLEKHHSTLNFDKIYCVGEICILDDPFLIKRDIGDFNYLRWNRPDCRFLPKRGCDGYAADYQYSKRRLIFFNKEYNVYAIVEHYFQDVDLKTVIQAHIKDDLDTYVSTADLFEEEYFENKLLRAEVGQFIVYGWISGDKVVIIDFEGPLPSFGEEIVSAYLDKHPSNLEFELDECIDTDKEGDIYEKGLAIKENQYVADTCQVQALSDEGDIQYNLADSCQGDNCYVDEAVCDPDKSYNEVQGLGHVLIQCDSCNYGKCLRDEIVLDNYPNMFFDEGNFNAILVVGNLAPSEDVLAVSDIISGLQFHQLNNAESEEDVTIQRIEVGAAKLASEVPDIERNIISIGTGCNNAVTEQMEGIRRHCKYDLNEGEGLIKVQEHNGFAHLIVKGYDNKETRAAARVLANYQDYDLKGKKYIVGREVECTRDDECPLASCPVECLVGEGCEPAECPQSYCISKRCETALCGNNIREPGECSCRSHCTETEGGEIVCTQSCLPPYCPGDCNTNPECGNNECEPGEGYSCPSCVTDPIPCKAPCQTGTCPQDCQDSVCVDSDGGVNYNIKGTLIDNGVSYTDFCRVGNYGSPYGGDPQNYDEEVSSCSGNNCWLVEHFCPGPASWDMYNCPFGCQKGACIQETLGYDVLQISTPDNRFEISEGLNGASLNRETIGDIISRVHSWHLTALDDGIVTNQRGDFEYVQDLYFNSQESGYVQYLENNDGVTSDFLHFPNGQLIARYELEFKDSFESRILGNLNDNNDITAIDDFENVPVNLFGKDYEIAVATSSYNLDDGIAITLVSDYVKDFLTVGETKTYRITGTDYEVALIGFNNNGAVFNVNGEATDELPVRGVYAFSDGSTIIVTNNAPGLNNVQASVTFYLAKERMDLIDSNVKDIGSSHDLRVNNDAILHAPVIIQGISSNGVFSIDKISIEINADDDFWVGQGETLSEEMKDEGSSPKALFTQNWDIAYRGLAKERTGLISFARAGPDNIELKFVDGNGNPAKAPIAHADSASIRLGDDNDDLVINELNEISKGAYFIVSDETGEDGRRRTYALRYIGADKISGANPVLKFEDLGSGQRIERPVTPTAANDGSGLTEIGQIKLGGATFRVYNTSSIDRDDYSVSVDLNGDGALNDKIVSLNTNEGAKISFDYVAGDKIAVSVSTPNKKDYDNLEPTPIRFEIYAEGAQVFLRNAGDLMFRTPEDEDDSSYAYTSYGAFAKFRSENSKIVESVIYYPFKQREAGVFITTKSQSNECDIRDELFEKYTKTYTVNGKDYEITNEIISDDLRKTYFTVNGAPSEIYLSGQTHAVQTTGLTLKVEEINILNFEDGQDSVLICLNGFENGEVDEEVIEERENSVIDNLEEGDTKIYTINQIDYEITLNEISSGVSPYSKFTNNGESTISDLYESNVYTFSDESSITPYTILNNEKAEPHKGQVIFGFNGKRFSPSRCTLPSGFACLDNRVTPNNIQLIVRNGIGFDVSDVIVSAENCGESIQNADISHGHSSTITINCNNYLNGGIYVGEINFSYTNADSGLVHIGYGSLKTRIESAQSFCGDGFCDTNEKACAIVCPSCTPSTSQQDCACTKTCEIKCPIDCNPDSNIEVTSLSTNKNYYEQFESVQISAALRTTGNDLPKSVIANVRNDNRETSEVILSAFACGGGGGGSGGGGVAGDPFITNTQIVRKPKVSSQSCSYKGVLKGVAEGEYLITLDYPGGYNYHRFFVIDPVKVGNYIILEDIGLHKFINVESELDGGSYGIMEVYGATYKSESTTSLAQVLIFEDRERLIDLLEEELSYSELIETEINGNLIYQIGESENYYIWVKGNILILVLIGNPYQTTTVSQVEPAPMTVAPEKEPISLPLDLSVLHAYLEKHQSDLDELNLKRRYHVYFNKGWNLFSAPVIEQGSYTSFYDFKTNCNFQTTLKAYDNEKKEFLETDIVTNTKMESYWINVEDRCRVTVEGDSSFDMLADGNPQLYSGWNYIGKFFGWHDFEKIKGDCVIEQGPHFYDSYEGAFGDAQHVSQGLGYLVKVKDDCTLGESSSSPPAPF